MFVSRGTADTIRTVADCVKRTGRLIARERNRRITLAGIELDFQETDARLIDVKFCLRAEGWTAVWSGGSGDRFRRRHLVTVMNCSGDLTKMIRDLTYIKMADVL